jgi:hypothetical protein|tara:strand:- start:63 stop:239 length:177 start_codon:yes stop_codon:yes gene_type:complete
MKLIGFWADVYQEGTLDCRLLGPLPLFAFLTTAPPTPDSPKPDAPEPPAPDRPLLPWY